MRELELGRPRERYRPRPEGWRPAAFKVIGPGLGRTGTTSLAQALKILGFYNYETLGDWYLAAWDGGRIVFHPDRTVADGCDAFLDSPVPLFYRELADLYPGSRVILTTREVDPWLASMEYLLDTVFFALERRARRDSASARMLEEVEAYNRQALGAPRFDREAMAERFRRHYQEVRAFFQGRPEPVLELDITRLGDHAWKPLCAFLEVPRPRRPFPRRNQGGAVKRAFLKLLARLRG